MRSPLRQALDEYLSIRRALGFKLDRAEKLLAQFITYLEDRQALTITIEHALSWAMSPADASSWWWAMRMTHVRPFAAYVATKDPTSEVPPPGLIASKRQRAIPYLYTETEIRALVEVAGRMPQRLPAATYPALISLLAVTGMRVGEAIALTTSDFDDENGVLTVRSGKFGKARLLPLHPSATAGLRDYVCTRNRLRPKRVSDALFTSLAGTPLSYGRVHTTFKRFTRLVGLVPRSTNCRPRIHDLRHSFSVNSLLDAYRRGKDVQAVLPRLATYLGHSDPKHTFWYFSAAPELLALAGHRLELSLGQTV